uniref:Uncharacterized protein n=1 Tax=Pyrodinium bahamense TaxID=73915 RepID=A0A7S0A452_9DINO|mmetsp:Transcript_20726/g.57364  ORF Transcript_20726/g.57364 Transcript_20726/m.57364 type:complete len:303 (+) Transcript_20726:131-1039(+)
MRSQTVAAGLAASLLLALAACTVADALKVAVLAAGDECSEGGTDCALSALQTRRAPVKSSCGRLGSHHGSMDCGEGVPLCGVLVLETGRGTGAYRHPAPVVHGLWPQVGNYGNSKCLAPTHSTDPDTVHSCYAQEGGSHSQLLGFQRHEWTRHGVCAGVDSAADYFAQVCALADGPLRVMAGARAAGHDLVETAEALQRAGHCVWKTDTHAQVELSACAGRDGRWRLAAIADFPRVCGGRWAPTPPPALPLRPIGAPTAPSPRAGQCVRGRHGPPCGGDGDCAGASGCLRCAHSGFCTDVPK